jgi:hypothetical protein
VGLLFFGGFRHQAVRRCGRRQRWPRP